MIRPHHVALGVLGAAMLYAARKQPPIKQVVAHMPQNIPTLPKAAHDALMKRIKQMVARKDPTTLHMSAAMIEHLKVAEGLRLDKYSDAGAWAIGWGHRFKFSVNHYVKDYTEKVRDHISLDQATVYLNEDILEAESGVTHDCHAPLSQNEFDACVDFVFNLGAGTFAHSDLCALLNKGDYNAAANEFPKWCHSHGVVLPGLLKRRLVEQHVFKDGDYRYTPTEAEMKPFGVK